MREVWAIVGVVLAGCAHRGPTNLTPQPLMIAGAPYRLGCPDVIALQVEGRPDASRKFAVNTEGRIDLFSAGNPRVEGLTPEEAASEVARCLGVSEGSAACAVEEYRSRKVWVFGPIAGPPRSAPWTGRETALGVVAKLGGIRPDARLKMIRVVRAEVPGGQPREAVVIDPNRPEPNDVLLQPFDEVHLEEQPGSAAYREMPDWAKMAFGWLRRK